MATLVIVPTYNESANIVDLLDALVGIDASLDVLVVDDTSPDGTSDIVQQAIREREDWTHRVELMTRASKGGRGGAVRAGLTHGIEMGKYACFVEMDADFSHDPGTVPQAVAPILRGDCDVMIGSRYPDGEIIGWPWHRRAFSRFANTVARILIEWSIQDYTNGYRAYSVAAAHAILAEPQRNVGYIYLSEMLTVCLVDGRSVDSFPIVFRNRDRGTSNTDLNEIAEAASGILGVAKWYRTNKKS